MPRTDRLRAAGDLARRPGAATRRARLLVAAVLTSSCVLASGCGSGTRPDGGASATATRPGPTTVPATAQPDRPAPGPTATDDEQAQARAKIAAVVAGVPDGAAGVAAVNRSTGARYVGGYDGPVWSASLYKLLVLETLLRGGGPLSGDRLELATAMIEQSDNEAGFELWQAAGGNAGLTGTLQALGMSDSVADGSDPTFTRITASDAIRMLTALVAPDSPLSPPARQQALSLMRSVDQDQRWGVGAAADGDAFANKNGWLAVDNDNGPGENDDGRWVVTSVGIMRVNGQQVLMAVMTMHSASMADGVAAVEALARQAAVIVAPPT